MRRSGAAVFRRLGFFDKVVISALITQVARRSGPAVGRRRAFALLLAGTAATFAADDAGDASETGWGNLRDHKWGSFN
jgi:hypothetical protein